MLFWMAPFVSDFTLSKDYPLHPVTEQVELLFSIKTGSYPLYAPGYHLGHSTSALTLGQIFHPISRVASLFPGYWNGKALEWNTFLRILSLGLTQLALFLFLRQIRLNTLFSFVLSLITVYNMRMLEAFRYGSSLEAFTGHLLLCAMIGRYYVSPSKWSGPLSITGVTYMLACSGHPPMMVYGFIAAGIFTLVIPFILPAMAHDRDFTAMNSSTFLARVVLFIGAGILLSSAYFVPFYFEFVRNNISYSQSAGLIGPGLDPSETMAGALNNYFMPFFADLIGSFGGSSLIIIALLLPLLRFFRVNIPRAIWLLWGILLYSLFFIQGPGTPVYVWSHKYIPLVSSLGSTGRISLLAPSIIMMVLAWMLKAEPFSVRVKGLSLAVPPYRLLATAASILLPLYLLILFLLRPKFGDFLPHVIRNVPFRIEITTVFLGLLSLSALVFYKINSRLTRVTGIILCVTALLQIGMTLQYGIWIEKKKDMPSFEQLKAQKEKDLGYGFHDCPNTQHRVVLDHLSRSFMEPFVGRIFTQVIPVASQDEAYVRMRGNRRPQQIFIEEFDSNSAEKLTEGAEDMKQGSVELTYSSFNRLRFHVSSEAPALFGLSYPYTGHWRAWVNGERAHVYRANGAAHAVEVPAGGSDIEFRYWSGPFLWGVLLTCATFIVIGLYACSRAFGGYSRVICFFVVIMFATAGSVRWYNSLYSGDDLHTRYRWTYAPPGAPVNIAYGKQTSGYTLPSLSYLQWHSSNVVDGDTGKGSGIPLGAAGFDRVVIVDLNDKEAIKSIVLYGEISPRPEIHLSQDGLKWERVNAVVQGKSPNAPLSVIFEGPRLDRYIRIEAPEGKLYIDELEVYPQEKT